MAYELLLGLFYLIWGYYRGQLSTNGVRDRRFSALTYIFYVVVQETQVS